MGLSKALSFKTDHEYYCTCQFLSSLGGGRWGTPLAQHSHCVRKTFMCATGMLTFQT
jgi:hypothetical protein